eukprot:c11700_g1_i2.p1 GENE.c11700_g1_i2~~c11700_g1_i2.p1  ORF type:complete len:757 (+),score=229.24 c11700_g1_i2:170-2440(+)
MSDINDNIGSSSEQPIPTNHHEPNTVDHNQERDAMHVLTAEELLANLENASQTLANNLSIVAHKQLQLAVANELFGAVEVTIVQAKQLSGLQSTSPSIYVSVATSDGRRARTPVVRGSRDPFWVSDRTFVLPFGSEDSELELSVTHVDEVTHTQTDLGKVKFIATEIQRVCADSSSGGKMAGWYQLLDSLRPAGLVFAEMKMVESQGLHHVTAASQEFSSLVEAALGQLAEELRAVTVQTRSTLQNNQHELQSRDVAYNQLVHHMTALNLAHQEFLKLLRSENDSFLELLKRDCEITSQAVPALDGKARITVHLGQVIFESSKLDGGSRISVSLGNETKYSPIAVSPNLPLWNCDLSVGVPDFHAPDVLVTLQVPLNDGWSDLGSCDFSVSALSAQLAPFALPLAHTHTSAVLHLEAKVETAEAHKHEKILWPERSRLLDVVRRMRKEVQELCARNVHVTEAIQSRKTALVQAASRICDESAKGSVSSGLPELATANPSTEEIRILEAISRMVPETREAIKNIQEHSQAMAVATSTLTHSAVESILTALPTYDSEKVPEALHAPSHAKLPLASPGAVPSQYIEASKEAHKTHLTSLATVHNEDHVAEMTKSCSNLYSLLETASRDALEIERDSCAVFSSFSPLPCVLHIKLHSVSAVPVTTLDLPDDSKMFVTFFDETDRNSILSAPSSAHVTLAESFDFGGSNISVQLVDQVWAWAHSALVIAIARKRERTCLLLSNASQTFASSPTIRIFSQTM